MVTPRRITCIVNGAGPTPDALCRSPHSSAGRWQIAFYVVVALAVLSISVLTQLPHTGAPQAATLGQLQAGGGPAEKQRERTLARLEQAQNKLAGYRDAVSDELGMRGPNLLRAVTSHESAMQWMTQRVAHKLGRRGSKLVLAFTGFSVCAAHGNWFNQSYAHVAVDAIRAAFQNAGVEVILWNQCMGGTFAFPYSWCLKTIVGSDVDLVGWDFGMTDGDKDKAFEGWLYRVLSLPSRPAAMLFSGYLESLQIDSGTGKAGAARMGLLREAGELELPVFAFEIGPALLSGKDGYKRNGTNKDFVKKDGSRSPPLMVGVREFPPKITTGQVKWHPAWKEHRIQGLILANWLLHVLQAALSAAIAGSKDSKMPAVPKSWYELPPPFKACKENKNTSHDMFCETQFECATEYEPRRGHSLTQIVDPAHHWTRQLSVGDQNAYQRNQKVGPGYLDLKMTYCGLRRDGRIWFELHHVNDGRLVVCEPSKGNTDINEKKNISSLAEGATFWSDGGKEVKAKGSRLKASRGLCEEFKLPPRSKRFGIEAKSDESRVCVSFLMWS